MLWKEQRLTYIPERSSSDIEKKWLHDAEGGKEMRPRRSRSLHDEYKLAQRIHYVGQELDNTLKGCPCIVRAGSNLAARFLKWTTLVMKDWPSTGWTITLRRGKIHL